MAVIFACKVECLMDLHSVLGKWIGSAPWEVEIRTKAARFLLETQAKILKSLKAEMKMIIAWKLIFLAKRKETRSAALARKEDQEQLVLIQEEERERAMKKKRVAHKE